jgi:DNA end-binding protein Ku
MKKQIALILAGTAASIAGGLRMVQELVDRGDGGQAQEANAHGTWPEPEPEVGPTSTEPERSAPARASRKSSKAELYELATELDISGRSKMSKAELIEAINLTD